MKGGVVNPHNSPYTYMYIYIYIYAGRALIMIMVVFLFSVVQRALNGNCLPNFVADMPLLGREVRH